METFVVTRRGQGESWRNGNSRGRRGNENPVFNCNQEETQSGVITRGTRPFGILSRDIKIRVPKVDIARIGLNRLRQRTGSRALRAEFPWMRFTERGKSVARHFGFLPRKKNG